MSTQMEAEYMEKYEPYIIRTVKSYSHCNGWDSSFDDMLQEARLAFLLHLRKVPDEAYIFPCRLNLFDALYNHTANAYGVSIPKHKFKQQRGNFSFASMDDGTVPEIGDNGANAEGMESEISFKDLMKIFSPEEQRLAQMLAVGYRKCEVQRRMGLCNGAIYRRVNSMRRKVEVAYRWM